MKGGLLVILFFLFLMGCQDVHHPEKPKNLISKEKMIDVLSEAYLANAARSVNNRKILENGLKLDSLIYAKYNIDSLQFAKSNAYYSDNMNMYNDIFQKVEERFNGMLKKRDSLEMVKKKQDSINGKPENVKKIVEEIKDSLI